MPFKAIVDIHIEAVWLSVACFFQLLNQQLPALPEEKPLRLGMLRFQEHFFVRSVIAGGIHELAPVKPSALGLGCIFGLRIVVGVSYRDPFVCDLVLFWDLAASKTFAV